MPKHSWKFTKSAKIVSQIRTRLLTGYLVKHSAIKCFIFFHKSAFNIKQ